LKRLAAKGRGCGATSARWLLAVVLSLTAIQAHAATAGRQGEDILTIVENHRSSAVIVLAPSAGRYERQGAFDLARYIGSMSGAAIPVVETPGEIERALSGAGPLLIVGREAFEARPDLAVALAAKLKRHPYVRTDGIILQRDRNRVYLAGSNDESDYFAVAELLRAWGVRWFMPGAFGECVPAEDALRIGDLNEVYASPFEIRSFWISWVGDQSGRDDFLLRNMMTRADDLPPAGHHLGALTAGLGKSPFEIPLTDPETAEHVADSADKLFAAGKNVSVAMEDGLYSSSGEDNAGEDNAETVSPQWDKYMLRFSITDAMLTLYNRVANILHERHPDSASRLGFLIYSNMFLPPVRPTKLAPSLFGMIAPIDIDPVHAMDDARSPERREFRTIFDTWAKLTEGRLTVYDYDQSMLVWRDLPNPSIQQFRGDVRRYRDAGILGIDTESRLALATTFINLYLRGRLLWRPDEDVDALLDDFYPKFFGPAAAPMADYWGAIDSAWEASDVTEHEFYVAPVVYTAEVVARLERSLRRAEGMIDGMVATQASLTRNENLYIQRVQFVRLGFEVLRAYLDMTRAAATDADYSAAVAAGEQGLSARQQLTNRNPAFTTTKLEAGYAFWPGEVQQYRELRAYTDGDKGRLVLKLPVDWNFHRDFGKVGLQRHYYDAPVDIDYQPGRGSEYPPERRKDDPADRWEVVRTDRYVQAQGIRAADGQSALGDIWYRTDFSVTASEAAGDLHVMFPGLFNRCTLWLNGDEVGRRKYDDLWWKNDYRFEWDVALGAHVRAGANALALRCHNISHMGGMFRRAFLYQPAAASPSK